MSWLTNLGVPASLTSVIGLGIASVIFKSASSASDPAMAQWTPQFLAYAGDLIALVSSQLAAAYAGVKSIEASSTSSLDSTTPTLVPPTPVISSDSGSSSPLFFSLPGPLPSPSSDTSREPSSGRDTRPWRPLVRPSPSSKDTDTSPSDASSESVPGSPDFP